MSTSKKEIFMRNFRLSMFLLAAVAFAVALAMAAPVFAAGEIYWNNEVAGNYLWTNDANTWVNDHDVAVATPVDGNTIRFYTSFKVSNAEIYQLSQANCGINLDGANVNLPNSTIKIADNGGRQWTFYDSNTVTPNNNPLANQTDFAVNAPYSTFMEAANGSTQVMTLKTLTSGKAGTTYWYVPLSINQNLQFPEAGKNHYYGDVTTASITPTGNKGWGTDVYFHGALNVTGTFTQPYRSNTPGDGQQLYLEGGIDVATMEHEGGEIYIRDTASGTFTNYNMAAGWLHNASNAITFTNMTWTGGTYYADADAAVASLEVDSNVTVPGGTGLVIGVAQTELPTMTTVNAYGTLAGDMTGADYEGDGKNVTLNENAIYSASAGPVVTRTELGSAILLQALTTANAGGPYEFGDNLVDSIYKGFALGSWTTSNTISQELKSIGGDLNGYIAYTDMNNNAAAIWRGDGTSTTANLQFSSAGYLDLTADFNKNAITAGELNLIKTFNLVRAAGNETYVLLDLTAAGVKIQAGQTVHVENGTIGRWTGKYATTDNLTGGGLLGTLELKNVVFYGPGDKFDANDTGTLRLSGRTFINMASTAQADWLEALGARLEYSGYATVVLPHGGTVGFDYDAGGSMPYTAEFLRHCDFVRAQYASTTMASDLELGHGRFISNTYNRDNSSDLTTSTGTKILYAGNAPEGETPWIGFAAMRVNSGINMEVYAPGAIVQVGTDDPNRLAYAISGFHEMIPTNTVQFKKTVTATGVRILSGKGQFDQDLDTGTIEIGAGAELVMNGGKTATVTGTLSGEGKWSGGLGVVIVGTGKVAPGNGVGELTGQNLTLAEGATYEWQVGDADGATPGTDWDVISAANITFDGAWTLKIPEANLAGSVTETSFIVASVTGAFAGFDPENVTIDLSGPGWAGGSVEIVDQDLVLSGLLSSLPGDADGDGDVDGADYIMVKTHFGGAPAAGTAGSGGDFNDNGTVDWDDLQTLMAGMNSSAGGAPIPEPATLFIMLGAGLPALLRRRRSRG